MLAGLSQYLPESTLTLFDNLEFFVRLLLSAALGALVGLERSKRQKEAGVRTHCIIACTSALFMILSKYAFMDLVDISGIRGADPARIAAIFREEGIIPVAQIAAFKDPISSRTDRSMAIHYGDGLWLDAQKDGNAWLNPYSAAAVEYVGDLVAEVQGMGFEQVILTNVQFPKLSRKQDYGETGGVSRADQLKADIAALQSRFAGSVTLWFSYTLDQCNTSSVALDVPAVTLGMDNLLVTADKALDADSRTALEQSAAEQGVQHLVLHSTDTFQ